MGLVSGEGVWSWCLSVGGEYDELYNLLYKMCVGAFFPLLA